MLKMMTTPRQQHQAINYLVVGLGLTGYSVAAYLLSRGYRCRVQDDRDIPPYYALLKKRFPGVDVTLQTLSVELIDWADALVVSPGLSIQSPCIQQAAELGKWIIGDIELFAQAVDKPVIAITGSNGKSTVTTLVGDMIQADNQRVGVGGNIGVPALDLLDDPADCYVLELSSYQLETTNALQAGAAVVLNLSADHLDRYHNYADYVRAKLRIYQGAEICVSNRDDALTRHDADDIQFSLTDTAADFSLVEDQSLWLAKQGARWLNVAELKISGRHNWANCLAAMALADAVGISKAAIIKALRHFTGIAHRGQWVAEIAGVEWINDSKATNVAAARASIEAGNRPLILIAGGQSKGVDLSVLNPVLQTRVKCALLLGEDADAIAQAWQGATEIRRVVTIQQAVLQAHDMAESGDCVLLAPACASFDQYAGFEARGDDFMNCVRALTHG